MFCYCFQLLLRNQGLFPVSLIQLTSRWLGAGREHSQTVHPSRPIEIFHKRPAQFTKGAWSGCRKLSYFPVSVRPNPLLSRNQNSFLGTLWNLWFSGFRDRSSGTDWKLAIRWWKKCSLFCIFIIM